MSIYKIFAQNLRDECTRFESIAAVCRDSGINRQQFNKYLSGSTIPNARTLRKLCNFLKIEDAKLFIGPEDKSALQLLNGASSVARRDDASLSVLLKSLNLSCRIHECLSPSAEIGEGYYSCYFPLEGFPNFLVRSVLKTSIVGAEMRFTRHTRMKSPSNRGESAAFGKHHGYVLDDSTSVILLGQNLCRPFNVSAIYIRKGPMYGLKVKTGLAFVQGTTSPFACRVCIEDLGTSQSTIKRSLRSVGIVPLTDPSISPAVANTMTRDAELNVGVLRSPSLDLLLGLRVPS
jgi:transcriptional regulator with XRE-family HTH domain